ncbi:MAG: PAS domain S-box protein [Cyanobacteria bacterium P01_F01_bin.86]
MSHSLATVASEISTSCQFLESFRQAGGPVLLVAQYFHQTVINLIHGSDEPWQLEGEIFQESQHKASWQDNHLDFLFAALHINKLILSVLFGQFTLALDYAEVANVFYNSLFGEFQLTYLHCYRAIAQLAVLDSQPPEARSDGLAQVAADLSMLETFATHAPMNFQHQVDLVLAERHRVLGQRLEAMDAYDRAIAGAKANGYLQEEALANELAAQCFISWDKVNVAAGYMQEAYYCYARWGANAKVADLQTRYPHLLEAILKPSAGSHDLIDMLMTVAAPNISIHASPQDSPQQANLNQTFDFTSILQSAQAMSSRLHVGEILRQLTQIILQNSGGDRCALMLPDDDGEWQVRTIATPETANFDIEPLEGHAQLPVQLIQYVKNRQEIVVVDDLKSSLPIQDRFLIQAQPKSVLCIPLLNQGKLLGIVYLSHQSMGGLFNRDRITVLNFLCSQAAIALENSRLYQLEQNRAAQLAESEARLQTLFDQATDAILLLGEQGFIDCNQGAVELFQCTDKSELIWRQPEQVSPEWQPNGQLSKDKAKEMMAAALQKGSHRFDWLHVGGRGVDFWAEVTLTPIKSQEDMIFHCLVRDISARKLLEQEEAILTAVLEATPDYIGIANAKGEKVWCNRQLRNLRPDLEHPNQQDISDYHPDWVNEIILNKAMPTAMQWGSWSGELAVLDMDGNEIPVSLVFIAHKTAEGKVENFSAVMRDMRDIKRAEVDSRLLASVVESSEDAIITKNLDSIITSWNQAAVDLFGYTAAEAIGQPITLIFPEERLQEESTIIARIKNKQKIEHFETVRLHKDRTLIDISVTISPLLDSHGNVVGASKIVRDISDRKAYEQYLEQTNADLIRATRMKDAFLATMSHELRTPLNAILGMSESLQEEVFGSIDAKQRSAVSAIESSGQHLLALINDILDLSKMEAEKIDLSLAPTDVAQLCYSSLALIQPQAQKKKIQIETSFPSGLPALQLDEQRIRQALINLLSNAVKFTPVSGRVSLGVNVPPSSAIAGDGTINYMQICVTDTGIGIAPENIDRLFQPFVQIDNALDRQFEGTGLGLALVKKIVELHGGRVHVTSEVGVGSCFVMDLPCVALNPLPERELESPKATAQAAGLPEVLPSVSDAPLILVVEDDEANIIMITSYLEAKGYQIAHAENGRVALEKLKVLKPSVVLMDIQMPVMDGLEATRRIREELGLKDLPIVALTAFAMAGDESRCLAAGANEYMSKPVRLKSLQELLQRYVSL